MVSRLLAGICDLTHHRGSHPSKVMKVLKEVLEGTFLDGTYKEMGKHKNISSPAMASDSSPPAANLKPSSGGWRPRVVPCGKRTRRQGGQGHRRGAG